MGSLSLLLLPTLVVLASAQQYNINVQEGDVFVQERLTMLGRGLQKIEVPHHHDLERVEVYLDFTNDVMVMKFMDLKKCQVSYLPHSTNDIAQQEAGLDFARKHVYSVSESREKNYGRLENPEALTDLGFLRQELQDACNSVPTYMTDLIDFTNKNLDESFLIPGSQALFEKLTHRRRRTDSFQCPITMFNQKCKIRQEQGACYWFVLCPGVQASTECVEHLRSGNIRCVPCCTHPDSPRDASALFKHCDVLNW